MATPDRYCLSGIKEADKIYIGGEKCGKLGRGAEEKALLLSAQKLITPVLVESDCNRYWMLLRQAL